MNFLVSLILTDSFPFILLITVVFLVSRITDEEPLMAIAGICSLIPYYIILYLNRHRMQEKFSFTIEKHGAKD